jgi:hypothetical protein
MDDWLWPRAASILAPSDFRALPSPQRLCVPESSVDLAGPLRGPSPVRFGGPLRPIGHGLAVSPHRSQWRNPIHIRESVHLRRSARKHAFDRIAST